jgi:hypothetical protein
MQTVKEQLSSVEERKQNALEQSALFPTRLAIARWTSGADPLRSPHAHLPARAAWLANAQCSFQAWLDAGGFLQHDQAANDPGPDGDRSQSWAI